MKNKSEYYGIDLGTTATAVAQVNIDNKPILVSPYFRSIVNLKTKEVGTIKERNDTREFTRSSTKINMTTDDIGKEAIASATLILSKCKEYMTTSNKAVITVPAYFDFTQREATIIAAKKAGIEVLKIINEPTAASLNVDYDGSILIVDLGGGTFDVSLVNKYNSFADVSDSTGYILGGDDLNRRIVRDIYSKCKIPIYIKDTIINKTIETIASKLKLRIQKSKNNLEIDILKAIPELEGIIRNNIYILTVDDYKSFVEEVFSCTIQTSKDLLSRNGYDLDDIEIVLVGGSTLDPFYVNMIRQELKEPLNTSIYFDNEEAVAKGAAIYAKAIEYGIADTTLSEISRGISIETCDSIKPLIKPISKIPIDCKELFYSQPGSKEITVRLLSTQDGKNHTQLLDIVHQFSGVIREDEKRLILLELKINSDGTLNAQVKDGMNAPKKVHISSEKISKL